MFWVSNLVVELRHPNQARGPDGREGRGVLRGDPDAHREVGQPLDRVGGGQAQGPRPEVLAAGPLEHAQGEPDELRVPTQADEAGAAAIGSAEAQAFR